MPPVYHTRTLPAIQPRRASAAQHFDQSSNPPGGFPFPTTTTRAAPDQGMASPTPKRPVRLSTAMLDLEREVEIASGT